MKTILRRETWLDHVSSWKISGLSISRYSRENGIKASSFRYWIKKTGEKTCRTTDARDFIKLRIPKSVTSERGMSFSLKYGSYEITIPASFRKADLGNLLEVLEARVTCL